MLVPSRYTGGPVNERVLEAGPGAAQEGGSVLPCCDGAGVWSSGSRASEEGRAEGVRA